jgi:hypothetical protein
MATIDWHINTRRHTRERIRQDIKQKKAGTICFSKMREDHTRPHKITQHSTRGEERRGGERREENKTRQTRQRRTTHALIGACFGDL